MATQKADVVIVGVGGTGGILAAELAKAGMKVIGLERGPRHVTSDFAGLDELRYLQRQGSGEPNGGNICGGSYKQLGAPGVPRSNSSIQKKRGFQ